MDPKPLTELELVAPCGINCGLCRAYQRESHPRDRHVLGCPGCLGADASKPRTCVRCRMKTCVQRLENGWAFCYECDTFPCFLVKRLDKRYRLRYGTSVIENLRFIQEHGLEAFAAMDRQRWTCPQCGTLMSMHRVECPGCGYVWQQIN